MITEVAEVFSAARSGGITPSEDAIPLHLNNTNPQVQSNSTPDAFEEDDFGYDGDDFTIFPEGNLNPSAAVAALDNLPISDFHQQSASNMKFPLRHLEEHQRFKTEELLLHFKHLFTGTKEDIGAVPGIMHKIVTQEE